MSSDTDLVGYTYQADLYCPRCIVRALTGHSLVGPDGQTLVHSIRVVESMLDVEARQRKIDRADEGTFDSGDFPKVVFRSQLSTCDNCRGEGRIEVPCGPPGRHYHGRCGDCDGAGSPDRCGRCRELLAE